MRHREEQTQTACVRWFGMQWPQYRLLLHHSPNGGYRTVAEGAAFKRMGTRAGFPDLILLVPRGGCPFLCIEMKTKQGRQSDTQKAYQQAVEGIGARYEVVRTAEDFIKLINEYLTK